MRIIGQIFEETDYTVFHRLPENRDVTQLRVGKIVASISEKYITNPIIVNEKMEIIDGQGRYEALKQLGKPVQYIIANGATQQDCIRMNKYNTKWTPLDFATSYAKAGKVAYKRLIDVCKETRITIPRALRLTSHGTTRKYDRMGIFERGDLEFDESCVETVRTIKNYADEIVDALQTPHKCNDAFYTGVLIMTKTAGFDRNRFLRNCTLERATYNQMTNLENQLKEFERIYNRGRQAKNKLFFSDYMRDKGHNVRSYIANNYSRQYDAEDVSTLTTIGA